MALGFNLIRSVGRGNLTLLFVEQLTEVSPLRWNRDTVHVSNLRFSSSGPDSRLGCLCQIMRRAGTCWNILFLQRGQEQRHTRP